MLKPHYHIHLFGRSFQAFQLFGVTGYVLGVALGVILSLLTGLSVGTILLMGLTGAAVFFGLTYGWKLFTGQENIVYYQHEVAILLVCALVLWGSGQAVLPYLDVTLMGIGLFLAIGRWGCFSVGCCHGRPARTGVCYGPKQVAAGFPDYYAGVPLAPIPLVESVWAFFVSAVGVLLILEKSTPGTALVWYTVAYGLVRFVLEYWRGDSERPYWRGFSEAQWTTAGLFLVSLLLSYFGVLPFYAVHWIAVAGLLLWMVAATFMRLIRGRLSVELLNPRHVRELVATLTGTVPLSADQKIEVRRTSLGLLCSTGILETESGVWQHYTISATNQPVQAGGLLREKDAHRLAHLFQQIWHPGEAFSLESPRPGLYHIRFLIKPARLYDNTKNDAGEAARQAPLARS